MGMKVFITGAGGYLGSVLAAQLAGLPEIDSITGAINKTMPQFPLPDKVNFIKMDVRSPKITELMSGHDCVIHSAFIVQWLAKMPAAVRDDINLNGTRNVAHAAVKNRVRRFLQASSLAAYDLNQLKGKQDLDEDWPIGK